MRAQVPKEAWFIELVSFIHCFHCSLSCQKDLFTFFSFVAQNLCKKTIGGGVGWGADGSAGFTLTKVVKITCAICQSQFPTGCTVCCDAGQAPNAWCIQCELGLVVFNARHTQLKQSQEPSMDARAGLFIGCSIVIFKVCVLFLFVFFVVFFCGRVFLRVQMVLLLYRSVHLCKFVQTVPSPEPPQNFTARRPQCTEFGFVT